jgi:hypothetical protein
VRRAHCVFLQVRHLADVLRRVHQLKGDDLAVVVGREPATFDDGES